MSIAVDNPFTLFGEWLAEATASEPNDPNAMALSTVGEDGMPSSRMVLLKDFDEDGFLKSEVKQEYEDKFAEMDNIADTDDDDDSYDDDFDDDDDAGEADDEE